MVKLEKLIKLKSILRPDIVKLIEQKSSSLKSAITEINRLPVSDEYKKEKINALIHSYDAELSQYTNNILKYIDTTHPDNLREVITKNVDLIKEVSAHNITDDLIESDLDPSIFPQDYIKKVQNEKMSNFLQTVKKIQRDNPDDNIVDDIIEQVQKENIPEVYDIPKEDDEVPPQHVYLEHIVAPIKVYGGSECVNNMCGILPLVLVLICMIILNEFYNGYKSNVVCDSIINIPTRVTAIADEN